MVGPSVPNNSRNLKWKLVFLCEFPTIIKHVNLFSLQRYTVLDLLLMTRTYRWFWTLVSRESKNSSWAFLIRFSSNEVTFSSGYTFWSTVNQTHSSIKINPLIPDFVLNHICDCYINIFQFYRSFVPVFGSAVWSRRSRPLPEPCLVFKTSFTLLFLHIFLVTLITRGQSASLCQPGPVLWNLVPVVQIFQFQGTHRSPSCSTE